MKYFASQQKMKIEICRGGVGGGGTGHLSVSSIFATAPPAKMRPYQRKEKHSTEKRPDICSIQFDRSFHAYFGSGSSIKLLFIFIISNSHSLCAVCVDINRRNMLQFLGAVTCSGGGAPSLLVYI